MGTLRLDEKKIAARVREFEKSLGIELRIAIAQRSGDYPAAGWRLILLMTWLGVILAEGMSDLAWQWGALHRMAVICAASVLGFALSRIWFFRRIAILPIERAENVRRAAISAFQSLGISRTSHHRSFLFYFSERERRLELLVDQGIHGQIPAAALEEIVALIRQKRGASGSADWDDAIIAAIDRLEANTRAAITETFPALTGDELPNTIVWL